MSVCLGPEVYCTFARTLIARTIAKIPALIAPGRVGQAAMICPSVGSIDPTFEVPGSPVQILVQTGAQVAAKCLSVSLRTPGHFRLWL